MSRKPELPDQPDLIQTSLKQEAVKVVSDYFKGRGKAPVEIWGKGDGPYITIWNAKGRDQNAFTDGEAIYNELTKALPEGTEIAINTAPSPFFAHVFIELPHD